MYNIITPVLRKCLPDSEEKAKFGAIINHVNLNIHYMQKLYLALTLASMVLTATAADRTVVFSETFGTATSEKEELIADHAWDNPQNENGLHYTWTFGTTKNGAESLNVRNNNPSDYSGASGNGNLYFNNDKTNEFIIWGLNTSKTTDNRLSFGLFGKSDGSAADEDGIPDAHKMRVKIYTPTTDPVEGERIGQSDIEAVAGSAKVWYKISDIALPECENMRLRFYTKNKAEVRIDDILITGVSKVPGAIGNVSDDASGPIVITSTGLLSVRGAQTVTVHDLAGRVVGYSRGDTDFTHLPSGLYIVRADSRTIKVLL